MLDSMRRHWDVLRNAGSLLATTGITSVMGFVYWTVAARLFSQRMVGYGSATISAVTLLATIGMFGLGTLLIGELPRRTLRRGSLVVAALLTSGLISLVLGLGFAAIASSVSSGFAQIAGTPLRALLITFSVVVTAVSMVFDQATIGVFRGEVQLFRNFVFSLAKLLLLPVTAIVLHDQFGAGITVSFTAGMALSLAAAAIQLRRTGSTVLCRPDWSVLRGLGRTALAHNWLNLALQLPHTLIPVLVTIIISPSANAAFYVAWLLGSFVYLIPLHLSTVLFAVAAADPRAIPRQLRFTLKVSVVVGLPISIALALGSHLALRLFGASYVPIAALPLTILLLGYLPSIPKVHYIAVCRATGKVSRAAAVLMTFAVMEVTAAALGCVLHGLIGLSLALLTVWIVEGIATTPTIMKAAFGTGSRRRASGSNGAYLPTPRRQHRPTSPRHSARAQAVQDATDRSTHNAVPRSEKAQQEAGLAVLMSLAKTSLADKDEAQRPSSGSSGEPEVREVPRKPYATPFPDARIVNDDAIDRSEDNAVRKGKKAQQDTGPAVFRSLATTNGPEQLIPGVPVGHAQPTGRVTRYDIDSDLSLSSPQPPEMLQTVRPRSGAHIPGLGADAHPRSPAFLCRGVDRGLQVRSLSPPRRASPASRCDSTRDADPGPGLRDPRQRPGGREVQGATDRRTARCGPEHGRQLVQHRDGDRHRHQHRGPG